MPRTIAEPAPGRVIGKPGGSVDAGASTWVGSTGLARVGMTGETKTAALLDKIAHAPGGPTVLHDLMFRYPARGRSAAGAFNVDHVVVSGRTCWVVDSKAWEPGTYFSLFGKPRRKTASGVETFEAAAKRSVELGCDRVGAAVANVGGSVVRPGIVAVWPSKRGGDITFGVAGLFRLRMPGARPMTAEAACALIARKATKPADPRVVAALSPYVWRG